MKRQNSPNTRYGYSLLEMMLVVAVMSTVAAGAVFAITNMTKVAKTTKLQRDVVAINNSIRTYMVNGGTFLSSDLTDPAKVLRKLKTRASATSALEIAGLRGDSLDSRLTYELQSAPEAAGGVERARFIPDPAGPRFVIQTEGPPGIREFVLDSSLSGQDFGTEDRRASLKLAKEDSWVWDYKPSTPTAMRRTPTSVATVAAIPSVATASADTLPLNPPVYSTGGGTYPLLQYDLALSLSNPNPLRTSSIVYSINGAEFTPYIGQPIPVVPGMRVATYSVSSDPDNWADSAAVSNVYAANIVPLKLALSAPQMAITYAQAGGAMLSGWSPMTAPLVPPSLSITNLEQIPQSYQNSGSFRLKWTYDGTPPFTSPTAVTGSSFSNGFSDQSIDFSLARWGSRTTLPINAGAESLKPAAMQTSPVVTGQLTINPTPLKAPGISDDTASKQMVIKAQTSNGPTPAGHRIYYTLDGTEPELRNGVPVNGTLYTGPFEMRPKLFITSTLTAKVFGPAGYEPWFITSPANTLTKPSLASTSAGYAFLLQYHNAGLCPYTWTVLGPTSNIVGSQASVTGTIAVGPLATLDLNASNYSGTIDKDPLGIVAPGTRFREVNIRPLHDAALSLSASAGGLKPTQTFGDITGSTTITATALDGMNIVNISRIKLASSDTITFTGGINDFFIVNVIDSLELTGSSLIKISGALPLNRVLINSPNGKDVKLTGGAGIMSITFLAPTSNVTVGGTSTYTGNILSGTGSGLHGTPQLVGGSPFGECGECCN